jgi:hypothetical protein
MKIRPHFEVVGWRGKRDDTDSAKIVEPVKRGDGGSARIAERVKALDDMNDDIPF